MAIYRKVELSFWTDPKVDDDFTPEDKYFYLYLLTNPHTNICGCYEIGQKQFCRETGYNEDTILRLLDRMETVHNVIKYDKKTKEILVLNWYKYNWSSSEDTLKGVVKVAEHIKSETLKNIVFENISLIDNKGVYRPPIDPLQASVTVPITVNNNIDIYKTIIDYLNSKTGKKFSYKTKNTQKHINARLSEGATVDDFKKVIDVKCIDWLSDKKMSQYLCPDTLFGTKFEKYWNQLESKKSKFDGLEVD